MSSLPPEPATADFIPPSTGVIRVLYADNQPILHMAVARLLYPHAHVLPLISSLRELDDAVLAGPEYDVILLESMLGEESSLNRIARYLRRKPSLRVVVYTGYRGIEACLRALESGALGYVSKSNPPHELSCAVQAVMGGQVFVSPQLAPLVSQPRRVRSLLSQKRLTILESLRRGASYKDIAFEHQITVRGVEYHVHKIRTALTLGRRGKVDWRNVDVGPASAPTPEEGAGAQ